MGIAFWFLCEIAGQARNDGTTVGRLLLFEDLLRSTLKPRYTRTQGI
jgi:hypothetical protein